MVNVLLYQILAFTIPGKYKIVIKNNKFKISAPTSNDEFELPGERILHQIFKIILSIFKKNMEKRLIILQL